MNRKNTIESLLNFKDPETRRLHMSWDKGDCSEIGLCEILLYQLIKEHKEENGASLPAPVPFADVNL